jgi:hypothetical protein
MSTWHPSGIKAKIIVVQNSSFLHLCNVPRINAILSFIISVDRNIRAMA